MFLVDTNVLLDIFTDDARWRPWSERAVGDALVSGPVGVNPIIYAETSLAFADASALDRHLNDLIGRAPAASLWRGVPGGACVSSSTAARVVHALLAPAGLLQSARTPRRTTSRC